MSDVVDTFGCGNSQPCPPEFFCTLLGYCVTCFIVCMHGGPLCDKECPGFLLSDYEQPSTLQSTSRRTPDMSSTTSTVFTTLSSTFPSVLRNILDTAEFPVKEFIIGYLSGILTVALLLFVLWCTSREFKLFRVLKERKNRNRKDDTNQEMGLLDPTLQDQKYQESISMINDGADTITSQEFSSVKSHDTTKQVDEENTLHHTLNYSEKNEAASKQFAEADEITAQGVSQPTQSQDVDNHRSATISQPQPSQASLLSNSLHPTDHQPIKGQTRNISPTRSGQEHEESPSMYPISEKGSTQFENSSTSMYGLPDQGSIPSQPQKAIPSLSYVMPQIKHSVNNVAETEDRLQQCPRCNYRFMPNTGVAEAGSSPKQFEPTVPSLNQSASNKDLSNFAVDTDNTELKTTELLS